MEQLLDFNQPTNVDLLDRIVNAVYTGTPQEIQSAQRVLTEFKEHPNAWLRVDTILEYSQNSNTKFYALQILESVIKYKWKILPIEQREGIKNYIVSLIIRLSSDENTLRKEQIFLNKLDLILVQIIKQEWPRKWEGFIPEIVTASRSNESLCENNMEILRLMSEEVFDFAIGQMTSAKIKELKTTFVKEFSMIYELCQFILDQSQKPSLLLATLNTLLRFLTWIPLGYVFETKLIETLVFKYFPVQLFRNITLECLTEIAGTNLENIGGSHLEKLFVGVMQQLNTFFPPTLDIETAWENATEDDQNFIQNLSLFFTNILKNHLHLLEKNTETHGLLLRAHNYLAQISFVDDMEVFKICLEYWNKLAQDLYTEQSFASSRSPLMLQTKPRNQMYSEILSKVRTALIRKMPKPEEVLIVEDENGEIVRETYKDSDAIALYKTMRETLVYLAHLDYQDTQQIMLQKLAAQVDGSEWSWQNLNTLCWAIGAISGALSEEYEKRFLVTVIKDLLCLCEMKRGKDNKAVIASNIMYIVGQYPNFLRAHWKFLKTVVKKLFEFMSETHPGVQDMACDTFLKISRQCKSKFVSIQMGEEIPFVEEILDTLHVTIAILEPHQIHTFYEAVGYMIRSASEEKRDTYLDQLMNMPNRTWSDIIQQASQNFEVLKQAEVMKNLVNILKTNERTCFSLEHSFIHQLRRIYLDMLNIYKAYSQFIIVAVSNGGPNVTKTAEVRAMRSVKKEVLHLIETFVEKSRDNHVIVNSFIPPLLEAVLVDYKNNLPTTRDPGVLSLMTAIISKLQGDMTNEVPRIFDCIFECTLEMITKNFEDYPEHRLYFFQLLRAVQRHCFAALFQISPTYFKLVIDSIVWAFKHTERQISETGLKILEELLQNIEKSGIEISNQFYKSYLLPLLQDVFYILTDTLHKSGFKLQSTILMHIFSTIESGRVTVPLLDPSTVQNTNMSNKDFLRSYVVNLLKSAFTNLTENQIEKFVIGLFQIQEPSKFKNHLRDFLVQLKEFSDGNNEDLYLEEREAMEKSERERKEKIKGLLPLNELPQDEMND